MRANSNVSSRKDLARDPQKKGRKIFTWKQNGSFGRVGVHAIASLADKEHLELVMEELRGKVTLQIYFFA